MISLFQIIFRNSVQESVVSWIFLQSQLWCPSWIFFDTSLSERCLNCWLVKINHVSLRCHDLNRLKSIDMAEDVIFSWVFEEKSPFKVECHVERLEIVFVAKSPLFLILSLLFFLREKKSKSKFWSDWNFLDLVDFQSTGSWDFSSLLLTRGP